MRRLHTIFSLLLLILLSSCENDPYETGDGYFSHMTTAFGETCYDSEGRAYKFITDNDKSLNFISLLGNPNEKLADKTIRSLLFYNITEEKNTVEPYSISRILTANILEKKDLDKIITDPLKVESVWMSPNEKYINLYLSIKTSTPEDESLRHKLGSVLESYDNGVANVRLIHDDGNIPGNYSVKMYFSIPMRSITDKVPDCTLVRINVMTFEGERTFDIKF